MTGVVENIWPIHAIAWGLFSVIGVIIGALVANATGSFVLNAALLLLILLSMTLVFSQGIGTALSMPVSELTSFSELVAFWRRSEPSAWIDGALRAEVLLSTGIASGIGFLCGILTISIRKSRY